jgi:hypothetical protein
MAPLFSPVVPEETDPLKKKKKFFGADPAQESLFSGLPTGEEPDKTQAQIGTNLQGMLTGSAYEPAQTQQRETLQRAARNLRAQTGGKVAEGGFLGQGAANKSQAQTEQSIFQGLADNEMNIATETQAMKERGLGLATDIGAQQQGVVTQRRGQDIGLLQSREQNAASKDIAGMNITSAEKIAANSLGLDSAKLAESTRQFNLSREDAVKNAADLLKLDYDKLDANQKQFADSLGLDRDKFNASKEQFYAGLAQEKELSSRGLDIQKENVDLARAGLQGFYDPYTGVYVKGSGQLAADEGSIKRDSMYGYIGPNGWVDGSIVLAAKSLGLQADTVDLQKKELFGYTDDAGTYHAGKYDLLSAADKREADRLYGYTDTATGVRHLGEMELSEKTLDIQEAVDKRAMDSMYGYTDPVTGAAVKGTAQIASEMLGLESSRYEDQKKELYGYTDSATGQVVKGKYELMNASEKRAADELYGYDYKDSRGVTQHVSGTLELQSKASDIAEQGLKIEEAKTYGYLDKATGKWVNGTLENEAERLGLDIKDFQMRRDQLYGYDEKDALGNVTNHVDGALETAAKTFGLQEKTVNAQITEMFGGRVDSNGDGILDKNVKGKYDILSDEQQRAADELYGYVDPETGDVVPGKLKFDQEMAKLSAKLSEAGLSANYLSSFGADMPEEAYAAAVTGLARMVGMEYPVTKADGTPLTDPEGNPVMAPGLDLRTASVPQGDSASAISKALNNYAGLTEKDIPAIKAGFADAVKAGNAVSDNSIEGMDIVKWTTEGLNRWGLSDNAANWLARNKGKLYQASNGRYYRIEGSTPSNKRLTMDGLVFTDLATGLQVKLTRGSGFPQEGA